MPHRARPTRLVVVQPYVPRYRTTFYRRSQQALLEAGVDMRVVVGRADSERGDGDRDFPAIVRPDHLERRTAARLRWRRLGGMSLVKSDLLLLEQAIKNLDGYAPLISQHFNGPSVGLWGHGRSYSTTQHSALAAWKQHITRRCDWFFAYTQGAANAVIAGGFHPARVSVLNNTLDTDGLADDLARVSSAEVAAWCSSLSIDPRHSALFLGGVDARKDIDYVLAVAHEAHLRDPQFVLLVGGAGESLGELRRRESEGMPVRALGRLDGRAKALALKSAPVLLIPSQIGLVAIDSFVSGTPILTRRRQLHGPEAEYLTDAEDSVWLPEDITPAECADELLGLLANEQRLEKLRKSCLAEAPGYAIQRMVDAFVEGVLAWAEVRRFGL